MKRALACFAFVAANLGCTASAPAADPRATQLTYIPWTKFCITTASCFIGVEARGQCQPSGGSATLAWLDNRNVSLSVHFGTKGPLEGAISVQIDQDTPIILSDPRCHASGCDGQTAIDDDFVERLKRSQTMTIEATGATHQKLRFSFPLADFAGAYDGPARYPGVLEQRSREEMKELMQRAEEQRKTFECKE